MGVDEAIEEFGSASGLDEDGEGAGPVSEVAQGRGYDVATQELEQGDWVVWDIRDRYSEEVEGSSDVRDPTMNESVLGEFTLDVSGERVQLGGYVQDPAAAPNGEGGLIEGQTRFDVGLDEGFFYAEHGGLTPVYLTKDVCLMWRWFGVTAEMF